MIIHFICRGNAFRSIIAEAYLKSLEIPDVQVLSSGTVASKYKADNLARFPKTFGLLKRHDIGAYVKDHIADDIDQAAIDRSDIIIFLDKVAYAEAARSYTFPQRTYVWNVADLGTKTRSPTSEAEREKFMEDVYEEIVENVEQLRSTAGF